MSGERYDINCTDCGRFILTEEKEATSGNITCVAGSYENGFYNVKDDRFYCIDCARKNDLMK